MSAIPMPPIRLLHAAGPSRMKRKNGTPTAIRTRNLRLRRPTLYPVELWVHFEARKATIRQPIGISTVLFRKILHEGHEGFDPVFREGIVDGRPDAADAAVTF